MPLFMPKEALREPLPCVCVWMGESGVSGEFLIGKT